MTTASLECAESIYCDEYPDLVPACTYTPERIVYSDASTCKHRFYGDEWNITITPLRPMETHIEVQRVSSLAQSAAACDSMFLF